VHCCRSIPLDFYFSKFNRGRSDLQLGTAVFPLQATSIRTSCVYEPFPQLPHHPLADLWSELLGMMAFRQQRWAKNDPLSNSFFTNPPTWATLWAPAHRLMRAKRWWKSTCSLAQALGLTSMNSSRSTGGNSGDAAIRTRNLGTTRTAAVSSSLPARGSQRWLPTAGLQARAPQTRLGRH